MEVATLFTNDTEWLGHSLNFRPLRVYQSDENYSANSQANSSILNEVDIVNVKLFSQTN